MSKNTLYTIAAFICILLVYGCGSMDTGVGSAFCLFWFVCMLACLANLSSFRQEEKQQKERVYIYEAKDEDDLLYWLVRDSWDFITESWQRLKHRKKTFTTATGKPETETIAFHD